MLFLKQVTERWLDFLPSNTSFLYSHKWPDLTWPESRNQWLSFDSLKEMRGFRPARAFGSWLHAPLRSEYWFLHGWCYAIGLQQLTITLSDDGSYAICTCCLCRCDQAETVKHMFGQCQFTVLVREIKNVCKSNTIERLSHLYSWGLSRTARL